MIENLKKLLNEEQDPKAVEKIMGKLNGLLMKGEEVTYIAVQKKPAINLSPDCVALTNKRIIFCRPKTLGLTMEFQDYVWKDVFDCHMREGILGAVFSIKTITGFVNRMDFLPKMQARKLYTMAQEQEEIQKEIRRQLALEEKRAAAGNVMVNANVPNTPDTNGLNSIKEDPAQTLQKLKSLLDNQLITEDEYNAKKAEILSRI
ncbi:hypothetical protein COR50_04505 [Chitinophaga caeni]|uniref:YokE-like PH domain-containing protein n=1 Tax=Chitinophaga caeni TaxID=2029983 RepID=A0A291QRM7_9BACT|nr:PH domain-containing protein [Chitinophaga caeni]ATL46494.1 hypothetical protein COR50_04505 [Chitinophaga caeni]